MRKTIEENLLKVLRNGAEIKYVANTFGHKKLKRQKIITFYSSIENPKVVAETFEKNYQILDIRNDKDSH